MAKIQWSAFVLLSHFERWLLFVVNAFVEASCFALALSTHLLLDVVLKLTDDGRIQLFEIELANNLASPLLHDIQYAFHILLRQLLYVQTQLFLLRHRDHRHWRIRVIQVFLLSWLFSLKRNAFRRVEFWSQIVAVWPYHVRAGLCGYLSIVRFKLSSSSCELCVRVVEGIAVLNDLGDVCVELSRSDILVCTQVNFYCG